MTPGYTSYLSADILAAEPEPPPPRRVSEGFWNFADEYPFRAYGIGPYSNGQRPWFAATGTGSDRAGGRNLPLVWSEIDLRGFRLVARDLDARNQFAIGFLNLLTAYHVHKGYGWQACLRGRAKTPYPAAGPADPLVARAQSVLDAWRDANRWPVRSREAFRRWRRDGEVFGRFFFGGWDRLPAFRFIDPELVGSPTGDTSGPDSFGVRTDPDDVEEIVGYHVWDANDPTRGDWIDAERIVYAKCNVDSVVKRGVTDFLPLSEQFDGARRLLRNMLSSTARQAGTAWLERFKTATLTQVSAIVPYVAGQTPGSRGSNQIDPWDGYRGYGYDPPEPPGSVKRVEGDREFQPTPGGGAVSSYVEALQASLRGCCVRWGLPEFATSDASNNNFASALVANSPFTRVVEGVQYEWAALWERPVALKVLGLACEAGYLTRDELRRLDVEVTEPQVATAEPDKDAQTNNTLHAAGVLSATTWQLKLGLDPRHEQANFEAEKRQGMQPGPEPGADGGGGGGGLFGESRLATEFGEDKSGLVKKQITNKAGKTQTVYVNPNADAPAGGTGSAAAELHDPHRQALADSLARDLPEAASHPGTWAKVKDAALTAAATVYRRMVAMTPAGLAAMDALGAVLDTPEDMKKFGYNPSLSSGTANTDVAKGGDPLSTHLGVSTHFALTVASKVLAGAVVYARKKLGAGRTESDGTAEVAELLAELFAAVNAGLGIDAPTPDAATVAETLRGLLG